VTWESVSASAKRIGMRPATLLGILRDHAEHAQEIGLRIIPRGRSDYGALVQAELLDAFIASVARPPVEMLGARWRPLRERCVLPRPVRRSSAPSSRGSSAP
jgi:hypothetical protein